MTRVLAAVLAALWLLTGVAPAAAAAPATCEGVWVVVDATAAGGTVSTGCATSYATGSEALASAGFSVDRKSAMICRIDDLPERCEVSPSAYWSYWQAGPEGDRYGAWQYAGAGPDSYHPRGGDADGWVFGDGSTPPSQLPETPATAAPSATAPVSATPSATPSAPSSQQPADGLAGPLGLGVVVGVAGLAAIGVWLARRRTR